MNRLGQFHFHRLAAADPELEGHSLQVSRLTLDEATLQPLAWVIYRSSHAQ